MPAVLLGLMIDEYCILLRGEGEVVFSVALGVEICPFSSSVLGNFVHHLNRSFISTSYSINSRDGICRHALRIPSYTRHTPSG